MKVLRKLFGMWTSDQWATYRQLSSLTDSELKDIGLSRCSIRAVVEDMGKQ